MDTGTGSDNLLDSRLIELSETIREGSSSVDNTLSREQINMTITLDVLTRHLTVQVSPVIWSRTSAPQILSTPPREASGFLWSLVTSTWLAMTAPC
jgi:hypothetical protein